MSCIVSCCLYSGSSYNDPIVAFLKAKVGGVIVGVILLIFLYPSHEFVNANLDISVDVISWRCATD